MTDIVSQIAAFIRARLDEDERYWSEQYEAVKGSPRKGGKTTVTRGLRRVGGMWEILDSYDTAVRELDHALMCARAEAVAGGVPDDVQATMTRKQVKVAALEYVVLRLSLEYFDHDGYLDEWKQLTGPLSR